MQRRKRRIKSAFEMQVCVENMKSDLILRNHGFNLK